MIEALFITTMALSQYNLPSSFNWEDFVSESDNQDTYYDTIEPYENNGDFISDSSGRTAVFVIGAASETVDFTPFLVSGHRDLSVEFVPALTASEETEGATTGNSAELWVVGRPAQIITLDSPYYNLDAFQPIKTTPHWGDKVEIPITRYGLYQAELGALAQVAFRVRLNSATCAAIVRIERRR